MAHPIAAITATAGYVPEYVLKNKELEGMVATNDDWIQSRTGIQERRILKGIGKGTSDMGAEAVRQLLTKQSLQASDIDLLICATVTPDHPFPSTANIICDKVGIRNIGSFDISAACSGFVYALTVARQFIEAGNAQRIIVVGADKMSSIINYNDRATCVLFGDGAGAVLVEKSENGLGIVDSLLKSDGAGRQYLYQKAGGSAYPATQESVAAKEHFVYQDGRNVFKHAVNGMATISQEIMQRNQLQSTQIDWFVPHQANKRIIDMVAKRLDLSEQQLMLNIQQFGNTTAATIPLCLWQWENQLKKEDKLILTAFGGGFTWGAIYLKWAY